jgi:motility quorum-sensing regulator/GCU-specific mRNA interferase toxin
MASKTTLGFSGYLVELTFKVYMMTVKRKPHHDLAQVKLRFATTETLEVTTTAVRNARSLGYSLKDIVAAVQTLEPRDFVKSETAHSPPNSKVWHDTYNLAWDERLLYLKFAGETLIDVVLTSVKEVARD